MTFLPSLIHSRMTRFAALTLTAALSVACEPESESERADDLDDTVIEQSISALHGLPGQFIPQNSDFVRALYAHEAKRWLRWVAALPWPTGPVTDQTGAACAQGQSGPIWLLAGTEFGHATRSCTIPKDKGLFFPLENYWLTPANDRVDEPAEMAEYQAIIDEYFLYGRTHLCNLTLYVDGVSQLPAQLADADEATYTEEKDPFAAYLNPDNYTGGVLPGGVYFYLPQQGHYVLLLPFAPGSQHVVDLRGALCADDGSIEFETSVTYNLTIGL